MDIYIAQFEHGEAALAGAAVIKETEKTYTIDSPTAIIGRVWSVWSGKRLNKSGVFLTITEAVASLISSAQNNLEVRRGEFESASEQLEMLRRFMRELRKEEKE